MSLEVLRKRTELIHAIRRFFIERSYLEVDTPLLAPALIPESVIQPFMTRFTHPFRDARELYLVPSPEIWMKRLLAEGSGSLFQISHCFRNAEQVGRTHNPEFTMLEWYSVGAGYMDSADRTDELLGALASDDTPASLRPPARRMSMAEAFDELAGVDLAACSDPGTLSERVRRAGLTPSETADWEELFNTLFLQLVEPELPRDRPLVLYDYPRQVTTLARTIPHSPWCERWELYIDGLEIANCFTEETDRNRVEEFYRHEEAKLTAAGAPSDLRFLEIFDEFPECSGVAMGIERLLMKLLDLEDIGGVIFPRGFDIFDQPG